MTDDAAPSTDSDQEAFERLAERLARRIVELQLAPAAIFFLESSKPLSFIASQALIVLEPIVQTVFNLTDYATFRKGLERRENVERVWERPTDIEIARKHIIDMLEWRRDGEGKTYKFVLPDWRQGIADQVAALSEGDRQTLLAEPKISGLLAWMETVPTDLASTIRPSTDWIF